MTSHIFLFIPLRHILIRLQKMTRACRTVVNIMNIPSICTRLIFLFLFWYGIFGAGFCEAGNFYKDFVIHWGGSRTKILENGNMLTLSLDNTSASGFRSKHEYMFGKIDMQLKLVPGNSAGTVTAYYLASEEYESRDEIDLEFLGNLSGDPYTLHTNIYTQGRGDREQQFHLWFDPTQAFHAYSILWNPSTIVISVDGIPIRQVINMEAKGIPFPKKKPMRLYSSIWSADQWATRGGLIKTDWSQAPFVASYKNYNPNACIWISRKTLCSRSRNLSWFSQKLDAAGLQKLRWVQKKHMIYNYCTDTKRFPNGFPPECRIGVGS